MSPSRRGSEAAAPVDGQGNPISVLAGRDASSATATGADSASDNKSAPSQQSSVSDAGKGNASAGGNGGAARKEKVKDGRPPIVPSAKPKLTKAERRAIQEAQRAAKGLDGSGAKKGGKGAAKKDDGKGKAGAQAKAKVSNTRNGPAAGNPNRVELFSHLPQPFDHSERVVLQTGIFRQREKSSSSASDKRRADPTATGSQQGYQGNSFSGPSHSILCSNERWQHGWYECSNCCGPSLIPAIYSRIRDAIRC